MYKCVVYVCTHTYYACKIYACVKNLRAIDFLFKRFKFICNKLISVNVPDVRQILNYK